MCGIFGVTHNSRASYLAYLGLHALQHRGEESAGLVSSSGKTCFRAVAQGQVDEGLKPDVLKKLEGDFAIGHVRYSTAGGSLERNIQPLMAFNVPAGEIAIAHNGNIPGYHILRRSYQRKGALFYTESDTEVLLVAIARQMQAGSFRSRFLTPGRFARCVDKALSPIEGAYSLIFLTKDFMAAVRDPAGVRPLALGRLNDGYVLASETNAFDLIGAKFERDIRPGEIFIIPRKGKPRSFFFSNSKLFSCQSCVFELVYFARPDSRVFEKDVYRARWEMGRSLARESPVDDADCVIAIPDSSNVQALGYAHSLSLPLEFGLVRSHYIGRTFIAPGQAIRDFTARLKYNPVRGLLEGKKVVIVDDSIVRGTTSKKIIRLIREAGGAKEIHFRVASPPIIWPCFYGIDMPTRRELIASRRSLEEIRRFLGVESLKYLSLEALVKACGAKNGSFCRACFDGNYKIAAKAVKRILSLEKKR